MKNFRRVKSPVLVFVVAVFILFSTIIASPNQQADRAQAATWMDAGWHYRSLVTIDHTKVGSGGVSNFPVLITGANIPVGLWTDAKADGSDLRMTSSDGATEINFELTSFTPGSSTMELWFLAPSLSDSTDTTFHLYWGNAGASAKAASWGQGVWTSGYAGVWHSNDNAANKIVSESTTNIRTGASQANTNTKTATGQVGGALNFNGSTDWITASQSGTLNLSGSAFTVEFWVTDNTAYASLGTFHRIVSWYDGSKNIQIGLGATAASPTRMFYLLSSNATATPQVISSGGVASGIHHVIGTFDGTNYKLYVDGVSTSGGTATAPTGVFTGNSTTLYIGQRGDNAGYVNGLMDETRISSVTRSADWIKTEYNNGNSPSTFYSIGVAQDNTLNSISGTIKDGSSNPISGVVVSDGTRTTTTAANGTYTINVPDGTYTLTPTKAFYEFSPATLNATVAGAIELPGNDFTGIGFLGIGGTSNEAGGTVAVAVNGTLQAQTGTIASGIWTIAGVTFNSGDVVTTFISGATEANESTAVTKYDGAGGGIGMVLNANVLSIGSDDNQNLSVTNLSQYTNVQNEDVMHGVSGSTLNVDGGGSYATPKLSILASNTLTISGTETVNTYDIAIAGTLTSGGNSIYNIAGSWDSTSGAFTPSTSTANFTASSAGKTLTGTMTGASAFYNLNFNNASGGWTASNDITVSSVLTITAGTFDASSRTITLSGSGTPFIITGTFNEATSTIIYAGASATNVAGSTYNNLTVNHTGTTFTSAGSTTVKAVFTITAGTFDGSSQTIILSGVGTPFVKTGTFAPSTSTVKYIGSAATIITAATYNNLTLDNGTGSWTIGGNVIANSAVTVNAGTLTLSDNNWAITSNSLVFNNGTITIADQGTYRTKWTTNSYSQSAGVFTVGAFSFFDINGTMTMSGGTFATRMFSRTYVSGDFSDSGGTMSQGSSAAANIYFDGNTNSAINSAPAFTANFHINKGASYTLTLNCDITVNDFYIDSGNINTNAKTITVDGSEFNANGQTINKLTINGDPVYIQGSVTIDTTLIVNTSKNMSILGGSAVVTLTDTVTTTLNGTMATHYTSSGYYLLKDNAISNFPLTGIFAGQIKLQADTKDITIPARIYLGRVEVLNFGSTPRVATLGTTTGQSITIGGNSWDDYLRSGLYLAANSTGNITLEADTYDPNIIVTTYSSVLAEGNIGFIGTGDGSEIINAGNSTWTVKGDIDFTGGTFTKGSSTVILNGTDANQTQNITSTGNSFNNLTIQNNATNGTIFADSATVNGTFRDTTASSKLTFNSDATYAFNTVNIAGTSGHLIALASSGATNWTFNPTTITAASYLNVSHSTNIGTAICAGYSTDGLNNSGWLFSTGATCIPGTPTNAAISSIDSTLFTVGWIDNSSDETGFKVYISTVPNADCSLATYPASPDYTAAADAVSQAVTGKTINTQYCAKVIAAGSSGDSNPAYSTPKFTLANTPSAPTISGDYDTTNSYHLDVTINPNNNPAGTPYRIQYSTDNITYQYPSGMDWQTGTSYEFHKNAANANLLPNTQYYLKVEAKNGDAVETSYSAYGADVTPSDAPTSLNSSNVCRTTTSLSWAAVTGANSYTLSYGTDTDATNLGTIGNILVTNKDMTALTNNTQYYFKVSATSTANGAGAYSSIANFTTGTCTAPTAPSDFAGSAASATGINWSWTDTADDETGWKVQDTNHSNLQTLAANSTSWNETALSANTAYTRHANVYNANGNNDSNQATVYTLANVPSAPTVTAQSTNIIKVKINQNSNPDANTRYAIFNQTLGKYVKQADGTLQNNEDWQLYADWGEARGFDNVGLVAGTNYTYQVKAENGNNIATDFSATASTLTSNPTVSFSTTSASGLESVANYNLAISLSEVSGQTITTDYTVTGGTAQGGSVDYTLTNSTATITAGQTTIQIPITIVDNHLVEPDKTIEVTISNPANATLGTNTVFTYTILNDDVSPTGAININSGAVKTKSTAVSLNLTTTTGTQMMISNAADLAGASWEAFSATKSWDLTAGEGAKTVYIKYKDQYGNESSIYSDGITLDTTAPAVVTGLAAQAGNGTISLSWTNPADSDFTYAKVYRGTTANFDLASADKTFEIYNGGATYVDPDVTNNTNYFYKVTAIDDVGNESGESNEVTGRADSDNPTTPGKPTVAEPTLTIDNNTVSAASKLTFNWTASTDINSGLKNYLVNIGSTSGKNDIVNGQTVDSASTFFSYEFSSDGTYYIRVSAIDNTGNLSASSDELVLVIDTTAPSNTSSATMYDVSDRADNIFAAAIAWESSTDAIAGIKGYIVSKNGTSLNLDSNNITQGIISDEKTGYSFYLDLSSPDTKASYSVKAIDKAGNAGIEIASKLADTELTRTTGQKAGDSSITLPSSIIGEGKLEISNIKVEASSVVSDKTQAKATWGSTVPSTSLVEYGTSTAYDKKTDLDTGLNSSHTMILSDISPATTYHFRVSSKDKHGNEISSSDQTFVTGNKVKKKSILDLISETLTNSLGRIWSGMKGIFSMNPETTYAADSTFNDLKTLFVTDIGTPTQSGYAVYWPKNKGSVSVQRSEVGGEYSTIGTTDQNFYLDLSTKTGVSYSYKVGDLTGVSGDELSGKSTISDIKIESGTISRDNASVIITFKTDKLAKSQVLYGEGSSLSSATTLDNALNQSHTILIENLKPNANYGFQLKSVDKAGSNTTQSEIQKFATGTALHDMSLFEIIMKALEDAFRGFDRWVKG